MTPWHCYSMRILGPKVHSQWCQIRPSPQGVPQHHKLKRSAGPDHKIWFESILKKKKLTFQFRDKCTWRKPLCHVIYSFMQFDSEAYSNKGVEEEYNRGTAQSRLYGISPPHHWNPSKSCVPAGDCLIITPHNEKKYFRPSCGLFPQLAS